MSSYSTLNGTIFHPTSIIGIYTHAQTGSFYLRNLRTGLMLTNHSYTTLEAAATAQAELENNPENQTEFKATIKKKLTLDESLDLLTLLFGIELDEWNKLAEHPLLKLGASHV